jgi:biotin carboxylase
MSRRVLLLSTTTGYQLRSFDDAAQRLGVEIVFATDRCHQLDDPWRDRAIAVRFHEETLSLAAIESEARRAPFAGIVSVGDRPGMLAARAARMLGLPGNALSAVAAAANKREARARFAAAGLKVPWHVPVRIADGMTDAVRDRIRFPCVIKPLGLSGSRGVIRADTMDALEAAFARIRALLKRVDVRASRTGLEDEALVEGFIPGREYAIEGVLTGGRLHVFAVFDKPDPLDGPFFEETIYVTPSWLDRGDSEDLTSLVADGAHALGLTQGPIHAECRIGTEGAYILEIAARPIGGLCSRALRFEGDRSLEEILLAHALGEDVSRCRRESRASAVMMIPIPKKGLLKRVDGIEAARAVPDVEDVTITAKPDQLLEPLPEAGSYLGFIFARAATAEAADAAVRAAHERLAFTIEAGITVVTP